MQKNVLCILHFCLFCIFLNIILFFFLHVYFCNLKKISCFFFAFLSFLYEFLGLKCKKMHKGYKSEKIQINVFSFFPFLPFSGMNIQIEMHFLLFFLHFCGRSSALFFFISLFFPFFFVKFLKHIY